MVRFNDKSKITELNNADILPMTDISESSEDKKVTVEQLSKFTVDNIEVLSDGKSLTDNNLSNELKDKYDTAYNSIPDGFALYNETTVYKIGDIVKILDNTNKPIAYYSIIDNNIGNAPVTDDSTHWRLYTLSSGGGLDVLDIGWALYVDESANTRRILNGQVIMQSEFFSATNKIKSLQNLYPNLFCTEDEWQEEKLASQLGQVGKFVIDDVAGSIRLPNIINVTGAESLYQAGIRQDADSSKVQPENVKGVWFIQLNSEIQEAEKPINNYSVSNVYTYGMNQYYAGDLDSSSWLKSEGQWNSGVTYEGLYNWALEKANNKETGFKFSTDVYGMYDFVVNTTDQTFRLPLLNACDNAGRQGSFNLFDTSLKDHVLTYEESKGWALQGTYVYKEAVAGSRYGYPDFYAKCLEEYQNSNEQTYFKYISNNITLAGSLSDNEGVLSGFSASNYAIIPQNWSFSSAWEFKTKINISSLAHANLILGNTRTKGYSSIFFSVESTGLFLLSLSSNGSSYDITVNTSGKTILTTNQDYYIKLSWDGTTYKVQLSTDNITWNDEIVVSSSTTVYAISELFSLGWYGNGSSLYLTGSLDLKETYINVAGQRFWTGADFLTFDYYKNQNGHLFYDISQKQKVDEVFNLTGKAWYYGVDEVNQRVLLPRTLLEDDVNTYLYICVGNTTSDTSWVDVVTQVKNGTKDIEDATNDSISRINNIASAYKYNIFSINTGDVDENGLPTFLRVDDEQTTITTFGTFTATTAGGNCCIISDSLTCDISSYLAGTYNIWLDPVAKELSIDNANFSIGRAFPEDAVEGDYLLNIAQLPYKLQIYSNEKPYKTSNKILCGTIEIEVVNE